MSTRIHAGSDRSNDGRGFSVIEVTVAIGLVAVLAVGVASVFSAVGETVSRGKRVSELTRTAARIERVMRADFEQMIRGDAFMVIHNEWAGEGYRVDVPLSPESPSARPRRVDEIMFFSRGDFETKRAALHPELIARSDTARVYYGHGQRAIEPATGFQIGAGGDYSDDPYYTPQVDDLNNGLPAPGNGSPSADARTTAWPDARARLGSPSQGTTVNPNEFAADWALLRHVTLLIEEPTGPQALPESVLGFQPATDGDDYQRWMDHSRQIKGHPAAKSIFSSVNRLHALPGTQNVYEQPTFEGSASREVGLRTSGTWSALGASNWRSTVPRFTSGIVDIATTSLGEIRSAVESPVLQSSGFGTDQRLVVLPFTFIGGSDVPRFFPERGGVLGRPGSFAEWNGSFNATRPVNRLRVTDQIVSMRASDDRVGAGNQVNDDTIVQAQQAWMIDAMPSDPADRSSRIRYEPVPPAVIASQGEFGLTAGDSEGRLEAALRSADLEMLPSSVFLPRCTEFIVEFSFGITNTDESTPKRAGKGELVWHGIDRAEVSEAGRLVVADLYPANNNANDDTGRNAPRIGFGNDNGPSIDLVESEGFLIPSAYREDLPSGDTNDDGGDLDPNNDRGDDTALTALGDAVNWRFNGDTRTERESVFFVFAYQDHGKPASTLTDPGDDLTSTDTVDDVEPGPWPWPTLIRVTMSFVDPSDEDTERTFQAIFEVPAAASF